jgi:tetraacyldisaccharide 4'-kinase
MVRAPDYVSALPVICVGNFTAGGAGKTPATAMIVARLIAMGRRPAILTRGYGGRTDGPHWVKAGWIDADRVIETQDTAETVGDEPMLHARRSPTLVARDRVAGARAMEADGRCDVIVMDDGLQNPALGKTLSIAVVDGARGFGNGRVIPAGPLRAPLDWQLHHVDAVLFNGAPSPETIAALDRAIANSARVRQQPARLFARLEPDATVAARVSGRRVVAFAGIGHPGRYFETVRSLGADLAEAIPFPDHHPYTATDAAKLLAAAARYGADLVTTEKDHVRLVGQPGLAPLAATAIPIPVEMMLDTASNAALDQMLAGLAQSQPPKSKAL